MIYDFHNVIHILIKISKPQTLFEKEREVRRWECQPFCYNKSSLNECF